MSLGRIDPLAQTFYVEEADGIYITKIGLYFSQVSATAPVTLELRNAEQGAPNSIEIIPDSVVTKTASQMSGKASADASVETVFEFDEPIYLEGNRPYAFCIKSPARNEYFLWSAKAGDFNLGTTESRVTKNPEKGALYQAQEGLIYSPSSNEDLKYTIYRALFNTASSTTAVFRTAQPPRENLSANPLFAYADSAEVFVSHAKHGFIVNDKVNISGLDSDQVYNGVLAKSILGSRTIRRIDGHGYTFYADSAFDSDLFFGGSDISVTKQIKFDTVQLQVQDYKPGATLVNYEGDFTTSKAYAGTQTPYARTTNIKLRNNVDRPLDAPHVIATDSNESLHLSGYDESGIIRAVMRRPDGSTRVAPYIDTQRAHLLMMQNWIDNPDSAATTGFNVPLNFVPETAAEGGSALAKHITKPVTLAQSASGIVVILGANRPEEADIDLYYRTTLEGTDSDILKKPFTKATVGVEPAANVDPEEYSEYRYTIGGTFANTLPEFNQYQIKVVMTSTNSAKIPRITDLRTIALGADQAF
jgi:hypothetical protein